jgi:hypothetical protein
VAFVSIALKDMSEIDAVRKDFRCFSSKGECGLFALLLRWLLLQHHPIERVHPNPESFSRICDCASDISEYVCARRRQIEGNVVVEIILVEFGGGVGVAKSRFRYEDGQIEYDFYMHANAIRKEVKSQGCIGSSINLSEKEVRQRSDEAEEAHGVVRRSRHSRAYARASPLAGAIARRLEPLHRW